MQTVAMQLTKANKSKEGQEINIHLAEVLCQMDSFNFAPALTLHSRFI